MALVHSAGRSFETVRERSDGQGGGDLGRQVPLLGEWRRRTGLEYVLGRPRPEPLYFGTGNAGPWASSIRNPSAKDNLYTSSIVALDIDTGKYAWHYQGTPADTWDYDADQDLILTDLTIDGQKREVLLHAGKNGFFYVLDRKTGQFISAKNFVDVNWATGYTADGKPIEIPGARGIDKPIEAIPGPFGAHNWQSMSYSPKTGFAYIPAQNVPFMLIDDPTWTQGSTTVGQPMNGIGWNLGKHLVATPPKGKPFGRLIAWDPVHQKAAWTQDYASPWNGGTLATAGGLVFQGTADGRLVAYDAMSGDKLWDAALGSGVVAAPMTYEIDGKQYVSIAVGWGGVFGQTQRSTDHASPGTVYTFAIGGDAKFPEVARYKLGPLISGREIRSQRRAGRLRALCQQLPVLSRRAGRRQRRQHPKSGICRCGRDRESGQGGVEQRVRRSGHAGFHGQAEAGGARKDQGVHPGHRRRDPAEVSARRRTRGARRQPQTGKALSRRGPLTGEPSPARGRPRARRSGGRRSYGRGDSRVAAATNWPARATVRKTLTLSQSILRSRSSQRRLSAGGDVCYCHTDEQDESRDLHPERQSEPGRAGTDRCGRGANANLDQRFCAARRDRSGRDGNPQPVERYDSGRILGSFRSVGGAAGRRHSRARGVVSS